MWLDHYQVALATYPSLDPMQISNSYTALLPLDRVSVSIKIQVGHPNATNLHFSVNYHLGLLALGGFLCFQPIPSH